MFYIDPRELRPGAVSVLRDMKKRINSDEGWIVCEGRECWIGSRRIKYATLQQLLQAVLVTPVGQHGNDKLKYYHINESGVRFLKGEKPYCDADGVLYSTMFELEAAQRRK